MLLKIYFKNNCIISKNIYLLTEIKNKLTLFLAYLINIKTNCL